METKLVIDELKKERDYFPSVFANKDHTIVILADGRTSDKTFSGMVIHTTQETKKGTLGVYSAGWTYQQFSRLVKGTKLTLNMVQED
jgi:hypothetical protein